MGQLLVGNPLFTKWRFLSARIRKLLFLSVVVGAAAGLVEYLFVFVLQLFLYSLKITNEISISLPRWVPLDLGFTLAAFVLAGLLRSTTNALRVFVSRLTAQIYYRDTRQAIAATSLLDDTEVSTAKTLAMFSDETSRAGTALMNFSVIVTSTVNTITILTATILLAPTQTGFGCALLLVLGIPFYFLTRKKQTSGTDISMAWQKTHDRLVAGLRNHFLLRIYGMLQAETEAINASLRSYFRYFMRFIAVTAVKTSLPLFLGTIVISALCFFTLTYSPLPGTTLVAFLYLFLRLVQSIGELSVSYNDYKVNSVGIEAVHNWQLAMKAHGHSVSVSPRPESLDDKTNLAGPIRLAVASMDFQYPGSNQFLFKNFNLTLKTGDCLLITGDSGSGKSTLLSLLLGLLTPSRGSIQINGVPIQNVRASLAARVGYVGPVPYVVEGTIRDNLLYGHPTSNSVSDQEIARALEKSEIKDLVDALPFGLNTPVNETASKFSTGQKQRLTLARALLRDPVILILDESSANLDVDTESKIIEKLKTLISSQITLIVSHRPAFGSIATHHLNMNDRQETGAHQATLNQRNM